MAKKCPPGVLCIENVTILFIILICIGIVYFMHKHYLYQSIVMHNINKQPLRSNVSHEPTYHTTHSHTSKRHTVHSPATINITHTREGDITSDPYVPPMKQAQQGIRSIRTRGGHLQNYKQIGYLKYSMGHHGKQHKRHHFKSMMPLFGRPSDNTRNKWNYYTIHNGIKLQVNNQSRSCTSEHGCDELFTGDTVYVDGLDHTYDVTVYETSTFRYSPNVL